MTDKPNSADVESPLMIPEELTSNLSESQRDFLKSSSATVRVCIVRVCEILDSTPNKTRLGDLYGEFAYLREALIAENNPHISIDDIMGAIVAYSAERELILFTRMGEQNYIEKNNSPG